MGFLLLEAGARIPADPNTIWGLRSRIRMDLSLIVEAEL